jgi:hypothetical protein
MLMLRKEDKLERNTVEAMLPRLYEAISSRSTWSALWAATREERDQYPWSEWEMQHWPEGQTGGTLGVLLDWIRVAAAIRISQRNEGRSNSGRALLATDPFQAEYVVSSIRDAIDNVPTRSGPPGPHHRLLGSR